MCEHDWAPGTDEQEFCEWFSQVDLQQEELKIYHEYRSMMEDTK
jgi:hypothetical protein